MSSNLLTAAEFARVCQVTPRTIRWYQQKGLIPPVKVDEWNKYAYFAPEQSLLVIRIKLLKQFDMPLSQIKNALNQGSISLDKELEKLDESIKEKQKEFELLKEINSILSSKKFNLKEEIIGPYKLFVKLIEKGDYYKLDSYINELRKVAKDFKLKVSDNEITFYLEPELKYKPKYSRLEVALIVQKMLKPTCQLPKNYYFRKLPDTKALTFNFRGPYNYFSLVYDKIDRFIKKQNIKVKHPVFEIYLKGPVNTRSSYDYLTKIVYPIEPVL